MKWRVEVVEDAAAALAELPVDIRAKFVRIVQMIEGYVHISAESAL